MSRTPLLLLLLVPFGAAQQQPPPPAAYYNPSWSPDGQSLVYETNPGGRYALFVVGADGRGNRPLSDSRANDTNGSWSPDGTRFAFVSDRAGGQLDVFVASPDLSAPVNVSNDAGQQYQPAWSHDGRRLAYVTKPRPSDRLHDIVIADLAAGTTRTITLPDTNELSPSFSPDGTRLAFVSNRTGRSEIYTMSLDGSDVKALTATSGSGMPRWSRQGRIAFRSDRDGNNEIYTMNADGTGVTRITNSPADDAMPAWSPDGTRLAYASNDGGRWRILISPAAPGAAAACVAGACGPPTDFANPFVEETKILHEWTGEAANDQFGWIARPIGDVDKDGVTDFVTNAPAHATGGQAAGRIYAYSTRTRRLLWTADGVAGNRLGTSLEAAGDTNKDGVPDVVATSGGMVRVFSGDTGTVLLTIKSPAALPLVSAAGAGDTNGDGFADVLAGSTPPPPRPQAPAPQPQAPGSAYVFSGKDGALLLTLTGERDGDRFGSAVAGGTRDGRTLLVVGAPAAGPSRTGRVYVYTALVAKPAFVIESDDTGAALGAMFVSIAGDADADGVDDVYASDFPNRAKGPATGRVYVHSGKDGKRLLTLTGAGPGEGFGTSASYAGDIDGDGHADLAVGAWQHASAAKSGGRIYVHSGKDGRLLRTITCRIPGDTLGFDSVGIGDTDGDGTIDLLITSAYSGVNGPRSGRVFLVSSGIRKGQGIDF